MPDASRFDAIIGGAVRAMRARGVSEIRSPGRRAAMPPAPAAGFAAADLGSPVAELRLGRARQYYRRA